ncbi:MAG: type II toxin-antitoxin system Phd/YefM family antitoxin [Desulfobacteraceae bacterium]|nr:type II toxin-antitoxin system Phd/YefM family antitoxin [Desulfobacteraceae bacterium]MBU4001296.1 type II toxin-antitoxin system Phd/YefM family antitoxin [Pseudomonadota bacterium]
MSDPQIIMPVTKVKQGLLEILKVMQEDGSTITLTRNGEAVGVMMTPDKYEGFIETIEILADKKVMAALKSSAEDFKTGRSYSDAEVWGK